MSFPHGERFTRKQFLKGDNGPSDLMKRAAEAMSKVMPKDWGFALIAFPLDSRDGGIRYVANSDRESVMKLLREFVAKHDAGLTGPPNPPIEGN